MTRPGDDVRADDDRWFAELRGRVSGPGRATQRLGDDPTPEEVEAFLAEVEPAPIDHGRLDAVVAEVMAADGRSVAGRGSVGLRLFRAVAATFVVGLVTLGIAATGAAWYFDVWAGASSTDTLGYDDAKRLAVRDDRPLLFGVAGIVRIAAAANDALDVLAACREDPALAAASERALRTSARVLAGDPVDVRFAARFGDLDTEAARASDPWAPAAERLAALAEMEASLVVGLAVLRAARADDEETLALQARAAVQRLAERLRAM